MYSDAITRSFMKKCMSAAATSRPPLTQAQGRRFIQMRHVDEKVVALRHEMTTWCELVFFDRASAREVEPAHTEPFTDGPRLRATQGRAVNECELPGASRLMTMRLFATSNAPHVAHVKAAMSSPNSNEKSIASIGPTVTVPTYPVPGW